MSPAAKLLAARAQYVRLATPAPIQGKRRGEVADRQILTRIAAYVELSRAFDEYRASQLSRRPAI